MKEIFKDCSSAIKDLHMLGPDKAPNAAEILRKAGAHLCNYASEIIEKKLPPEALGILRSCLAEMHPDTEYIYQLAVARDLLDIAVTLEAMTEISGAEYKRIRRNPTKISDAVMFFIDLEKVEQ